MVYQYLGRDGSGGVGRGGVEWESGVLVFPTELACAQRIAGPCRHEEILEGDLQHISFGWGPPHTGMPLSLWYRGGVAEQELDVEGRGAQWEAVMTLMLLSGEYTSRHLQQVAHLPLNILLILSAASPFLDVPAASRGVIVHWVVLILLNHPGAEEGLEQALVPFASRGLNDARCHPAKLIPTHDSLTDGVTLRLLDRPCFYASTAF